MKRSPTSSSPRRLCVALYARVSSDQQAQAGTIESQLQALKERIRSDGYDLEDELCFLDDGYSGATLQRPALERLRDVIYAGGVDILYVHSPDRLARNYAWQVLLLDEFARSGVKVVFLNHEPGQSPEGELLLQMQGMIAEYERAKILERSRRGKRHAARRGDVSVLSGAPYGYRYVSKRATGGPAQYQVVLEEARVVQRIFEWVGREGLSLREVCRRLQRGRDPDPHGQDVVGLLHARRDAEKPCLSGLGGVRQDRGRPPSAAAPRAPRPAGTAAPQFLDLRRPPRGPGGDRRSAAGQRRAV
jgi:site-specific DNA recombinase